MSYDADNSYPQRVSNAVAASGTATACVDLFSKHLRGLGFSNKELDKIIVNTNEETLGDLHKMVCNDRAKYKGFAIWIGYNALLEPVYMKHVPFETVRLGEEDDTGAVAHVVIHPDWYEEGDRPFSATDPLEIDLWTSSKSKILSQIEKAEGFNNWNGHVFYYSEAGNERYPVATCDSVFEDVITDAGIKRFKSNGVQTGFMAYYMMLYKGEFESDRAFEKFSTNLNKFQGVDNSHRILVVECPTEESIPELKKLEPVDVDRLFEFTEESCRENIIRAFEQPISLHWIKTAGQLGYSKEYDEAKLYYDQKTENSRQGIGQVFSKIMTNWSSGITLDESGFKVLSLSGEISIGENRTMVKELGREAMTDIKGILESDKMDADAKVEYIADWYGIDRLKVIKWVKNGTAT